MREREEKRDIEGESKLWMVKSCVFETALGLSTARLVLVKLFPCVLWWKEDNCGEEKMEWSQMIEHQLSSCLCDLLFWFKDFFWTK